MDRYMIKKKKYYGDPRFYKILQGLADLHSRKSHDYAGEENPLRNFMRARDMGIEPWKGIAIRLGDKMSRVESFARTPVLLVSDESVIDTFDDIAVYAIHARLLFEDEKKKHEKLH